MDGSFNNNGENLNKIRFNTFVVLILLYITINFTLVLMYEVYFLLYV